MKIKNHSLIKAVLFVAFLFVFTSKTFAYGYETHALLTEESINFFNSKYSEISPDLGRYLVDGSRREDDVPRWLNHFYDPVYDRGVSYDAAIDPTFQLLQVLGDQSKSKDWAVDSNLQSSFLYKVASKIKPATVASMLTAEEIKGIEPLNAEADFTWDRALKLYISGEEEKAMFALGHVIHLVQDASVPDHTRNDPHTGDSPYEKYASQFNLNNPDNELRERLSNGKITSKDSLSGLFGSLAEYSNNNFYSKDTVGIQSGYSLPSPVYFGRYNQSIYSYGFTEKDEYGELPIIIGGGLIGIQGQGLIDDNIIQSAYWTRLSTKAVTYSAATIDLFLNEAERLKDDPEFNKEEKGFLAKVVDAIGNFFSDTGKAFTDMFGSSGGDIIAEIPERPESKESIVPAKVSVDKISVHPGETIIESGSGFPVNSEINLLFTIPSGATVSASIMTSDTGSFEHAYAVPWTAALGQYEYWAESSNLGIVTDKVKFRITAPDVKDEKENLERPSESIASTESENDKEQEDSFVINIPKECSFAGSGSSSSKKVVINEVAWMGSTLSPNAEWVELKNNSSTEEDISGWWLIDQAEQVKIVIPAGTILPAGDFFLFERGDDDSVPGVKADIIYTGTLSNSKEGLRLINSECVIEDEAIADPDWPAGDSSARRSMERKDDVSGWHTSEFVDGTPKQQNSRGLAVIVNPVISPARSPGSSGGGKTTPSCSQAGLESSSGEILFNEIAWSGDASSSGHEWIELLNISDVDVDISDWQLLDKAENIKIIFPAGKIIGAGDYYIILRGDENFIMGVEADMFFTGSINNSDETLRLFDNKCSLVDEIKDTGANWKNFGGSTSPDYRTAERGIDGSWHSYAGEVFDIMGTPKAINSAPAAEPVAEDDEEGADDDGSGEGGSSWGSQASGLVISEIMPGMAGDTDNEFIELYNPTDSEISLDGWSLKRKATLSGSVSNLVSAGSEKFKGLSIAPKGFFLIASNQYSGEKIPDVKYSQDTNFLANNGDIIVFYNEQNSPILVTGYESIDSGKSWERKAFSGGVCFKSINDWEFSGNGCVADDQVVWDVRESPRPQNSESLIEPRNKPVWPFTSSDVSASYNADKIEVDISWPSFSGIARVSGEGGVVWSGPGTDAETSAKLYEVGKVHDLYFDILDMDGLASNEKATFSINVPKIIDDFKIYSAAKMDFDGVEKNGPMIDFSWSDYPILPRDIGLALAYGEPAYSNYKIMVFYKNMDVPDDEFLEFERPRTGNCAKLCYYGEESGYECVSSLIMADVPGTYIVGAPNGKAIKHAFYLEDGDERLVLPMGESVLPSDYFTVGYYAFHRSYSGGTPEEQQKTFILVAKDNAKITLSAEPTHEPPSAPGSPQFQIRDGIKLIVSWDPSVDPDSPDGLIRYEISYDNGESWSPAVTGAKTTVVPGMDIDILVRAIDDFGVRSDAAALKVSVPVIPGPPEGGE